jgi:UDP-GlcNAc:undecaprenyl-phosphate GlcNAc-1-phosphate transferase
MQATVSLGQVNVPPFAAYSLIFALAFVLALILTPLSRWAGERWGLVAVPGGRRKHTTSVSRIGGVSVYLAFVLAVILSQFLIAVPGASSNLPAALQVVRLDPKEVFRVIGLLAGGTFIFVAGLYDDWRDLSPTVQYLTQLFAAAIAVAFLILIEYVNNPISGQQTPDFPYAVTVTITIFWLGLMMNTVNWLDGLDGLAAGVAALACIVLFINAVFRLNPPQYSVSVLPVALLGAMLGFLPFNFAPAKIFLGSSGAYFLGYVLGVLSIIGGAKMASILLVMGLPLLDLAWQVVRRISRGRNPVQGDRGHLHFRLLDMGISQRQIVLGYYLFCAIFGGIALATPSRLFKLIAILVMVAISLIGFFRLSKIALSDDELSDIQSHG